MPKNVIVWPASPLDGMACAPKGALTDQVAGHSLYTLDETRGGYRKGDSLWLKPDQVKEIPPAGQATPAPSVPAPSSFREAGAVVPSGGAGSFPRPLVPVSEGVEGPTVLDQVRA